MFGMAVQQIEAQDKIAISLIPGSCQTPSEGSVSGLGQFLPSLDARRSRASEPKQDRQIPKRNGAQSTRNVPVNCLHRRGHLAASFFPKAVSK